MKPKGEWGFAGGKEGRWHSLEADCVQRPRGGKKPGEGEPRGGGEGDWSPGTRDELERWCVGWVIMGAALYLLEAWLLLNLPLVQSVQWKPVFSSQGLPEHLFGPCHCQLWVWKR